MFKSTMPQNGKIVHLHFDGEAITAFDGDNLAAALLRAGKVQFRTAENNDLRGPYCMMGVCFECLVEINGRPNQQACQITVRDGMMIQRQNVPDNAGKTSG
ncbi:MAG: (2Fe-2S)-binding protein [Candidatus Puniceispirillaceae bacterium]